MINEEITLQLRLENVLDSFHLKLLRNAPDMVKLLEDIVANPGARPEETRCRAHNLLVSIYHSRDIA